MLVVISNHARALTDTISVRLHTCSVQCVLAGAADDTIVGRGSGARLAEWRASSTGGTAREAAIRTNGARGSDRLRSNTLRPVVGVLSKSGLARDAT